MKLVVVVGVVRVRVVGVAVRVAAGILAVRKVVVVVIEGVGAGGRGRGAAVRLLPQAQIAETRTVAEDADLGLRRVSSTGRRLAAVDRGAVAAGVAEEQIGCRAGFLPQTDIGEAVVRRDRVVGRAAARFKRVSSGRGRRTAQGVGVVAARVRHRVFQRGRGRTAPQTDLRVARSAADKTFLVGQRPSGARGRRGAGGGRAARLSQRAVVEAAGQRHRVFVAGRTRIVSAAHLDLGRVRHRGDAVAAHSRRHGVDARILRGAHAELDVTGAACGIEQIKRIKHRILRTERGTRSGASADVGRQRGIGRVEIHHVIGVVVAQVDVIAVAEVQVAPAQVIACGEERVGSAIVDIRVRRCSASQSGKRRVRRGKVHGVVRVQIIRERVVAVLHVRVAPRDEIDHIAQRLRGAVVRAVAARTARDRVDTDIAGLETVNIISVPSVHERIVAVLEVEIPLLAHLEDTLALAGIDIVQTGSGRDGQIGR